MCSIHERVKRIGAILMCFFIVFSYMPGMTLWAEASTEEHDHTVSITKIEELEVAHPYAGNGDTAYDGLEPMPWKESEVTNSLTEGATVYAPTNMGEDYPYSYAAYGMEFSGAETLSFDYMTSCEDATVGEDGSETSKDALIVMLDGETVLQADGETPWTKHEITGLDAHSDHTLYFIYAKDGEGTSGADAAYISNTLVGDVAVGLDEAEEESSEEAVEESAAVEEAEEGTTEETEDATQEQPVMLANEDEGVAIVSNDAASKYDALAGLLPGETTEDKGVAKVEYTIKLKTTRQEQGSTNIQNVSNSTKSSVYRYFNSVTAAVKFANEYRGTHEGERIYDRTETEKFLIWTTTYDYYIQENRVVGGKVIVVKNDTITENITIDSGVTLLVPYNDGSGDSTNESTDGIKPASTTPKPIVNASWLNSEPNKTLTIDSDVTVTVKGVLVAAGAYGIGNQPYIHSMTSGSYGRIKTMIDSEIIVESEGRLSAYGLIDGEGKITAQKGGTIEEPFLVQDFPGGTITSNVVKNYFPFSQYGINNIQSKMIIHYGGSLIGKGKLYAQNMFLSGEVRLISSSSGSLFILKENSYVEITYDKNLFVDDNDDKKSMGKSVIKITGGATIGNISVKAGAFSSADTSGKYLAVPYSMDIILDGDDAEQASYDIGKNVFIKVMPGAKVTVCKGASLNINSGGRFFVYDGLIEHALGGRKYPSAALLNEKFSKTGQLVVDGTLNVGSGGAFAGTVQTNGTGTVVTASDAILTSTINGAEYSDGVLGNSSTGDENTTYFDIPARYWNGYEFKELVAGKTYIAYNGNGSVTKWDHPNFECKSWKEGSNITHEYDATTGKCKYASCPNPTTCCTLKYDGTTYKTEPRVGAWNVYDILPSEGFEIIPVTEGTDRNPAPEGDDFNFKIVAKPGYKLVDSYTVWINGTKELNPNEDGSYTITGVTETQNVTIKATTGESSVVDLDPVIQSASGTFGTTSAELKDGAGIKVKDTANQNKITLNVEDLGSGIKSVSYAEFDEAVQDTDTINNWTNVFETDQIGTTTRTEEITLSTATADYNKYVYVKVVDHNDKTTVLSLGNIILDDHAPVIAIEANTDPVKSLINKISNGLFFKEYIEITIHVSDEGSGMKSYDYAFVNPKDYSNAEAIPAELWTTVPGAESITKSISEDDKFVVYVKAHDNIGHVTNESTAITYVDTTKPIIKFSYTANGQTKDLAEEEDVIIKADSATLHIEGVDPDRTGKNQIASGCATLEYSYDNATWYPADDVTQELTLSNETKTIYARTTDYAENESGTFNTGSICIDGTAPSIQAAIDGESLLNVGDLKTYQTNTKTLVISVEEKEDSSGLAKVEYAYSEKKESSADLTWSEISISEDGLVASTVLEFTTDSQMNNKYIHIRTTDNAGNNAEATTAKILVDNTKPTGDILIDGVKTPNNDAFYKNEDVTVAINAVDNYGCKETKYYIADHLLTDNEISSIDWYGENAGVYEGAFTYPKTDANVDTEFYIYARLTDNANNANVIHSEKVVVDKTLPTATFTVTDDNGNSSLLSNTALNAVFNIDETYLAYAGYQCTNNLNEDQSNWIDITDATSARGTRIDSDFKDTYILKLIDKAGNVNYLESETIIVDKTKPTELKIQIAGLDGDIEPGESDWEDVIFDNKEPNVHRFNQDAISLRLSAEDGEIGSGLKDIQYLISDVALSAPNLVAGWKVYEKPIIFDKNQNLYVYARATDYAGNTVSFSSEMIVFDNTAPTVSVTTGRKYYQSTSVDYTVSKTDNMTLENLLSEEYYVGEAGLTVEQLTQKNWESEPEFMENSVQTLYVKVTDECGNVTYANSDDIIIDNIVPTGTIKVDEHRWNSLLNNITFGLFFKDTKEVTVETGGDLSGIASTAYAMKETVTAPEEITSWIPFAGKFNVEPDQKAIVYVKITDNAGNLSYISSDGMVLDGTKPIVTLSDGKTEWKDTTANGIAYKDAAQTLTLTAEDNLAELKSVQYAIYAGEDKIDETSAELQWADYNAEEQIKLSTDQNVIVYARAEDKAGNVSYACTNRIVVDLTDPTGSITFEDDTVWNGFTESINHDIYRNSDITLQITAKDTNLKTVESFVSTSTPFSKEQLKQQTWNKVENHQVVLTVPENIEDQKRIVYIRMTDEANRVTYLSSGGFVLDNVAPKITLGTEMNSDEDNYGTEDFKVQVYDANYKVTTLNGQNVENKFTIQPLLEEVEAGTKGYTIVATDNAGNTTAKAFNYYKPLSINFVDEDRITSFGKKDDYKYGEAVVVPKDPTKQATATEEYAFVGWVDQNGQTYNSTEIPVVSGDMTYTAKYRIATYKVNVASVNADTDDYIDEESQFVNVGETLEFKAFRPTDDEVSCYVKVMVDGEVVDPVTGKDHDVEAIYQLEINKSYNITTELVPHDDKREVKVAPGCETTGWLEKTCEHCESVRTEGIAETGHAKPLNDEGKPVGEVTEPKCTEQGYTTYNCKTCGEAFVDDYTDPLGHDFSFADGDTKVQREATCTVPGIMEGHCTRCSDFTTQDIAPIGHSWGKAERVIDPTCTTKGLDMQTCENEGCGDTKTTILAANGHEEINHDPKAATCTDAGWNAYVTCANCNYTTYEEIPAKGHDYNSVVINPTCTEGGYTTYTCACGDTYKDDETTAKGHNYGPGEIIKNATCTTDGEKKFTCLTTNCGHEKIEVIDPTGHSYAAGAVTAPTCTEQGYTTYTCSNCPDSYRGDMVPAIGHKYKGKVTEPTCTTDGFTTYSCQNEGCGHTYEDDFSAKKGHKYEATVIAPTCTEGGYTQYKCLYCGDTYKDTETVEALGHDYEAVVTEPTCTEKGYTTHTCANCKDVFVDTYTDPDGHEWDEVNRKIINEKTCTAYGVYSHTCTACKKTELYTEDPLGHNYVPTVYNPTCTEPGKTVYNCSQCDKSYDVEGAAANGHTIVIDDAVDPTCTETGLTQGSHCDVCPTVFIPQTEVAAKGHSYGAWTTTKPATCTEEGQEERICTVCDEGKQTAVINALGHDPTGHEGQKASCLEDGYKPYETCSRCDYSTYEVIPATGHTVVTDAAVAPTCTETGLTEGSHCSVCGDVLTAQTVVDSLGHTTVTDAAVAPTCKTTGLTEGSHCSVCGEILVAQNVVDALGHDWDSEDAERNVIIEPTCEEQGLELVTCGRGGCDENKTFAMDALGHKPAIDYAKAPTCTDTGLTEGSHCSVCSEVLKTQEEVKALGHEYNDWRTTTAPTCTKEGEQTRTCETCGDVDRKSVPATGHSFPEEWTEEIAPTCTEAGKAISKCQNTGCDETETKTIDALGHTAVTDIAVAPTCTETGLTEGSHCSVCNTVLTAQETIPAAGHTMGDWEVVTAAKCETIGEEKSVCTVDGCGHTEYQDIPALGHKEVIDPAVEPTCTEKGWEEGSHCSVCGNVLIPQVEINPLNHDIVEHPYQAPTCTEDGHEAYETCNRCDYVTEYEVLSAPGHNWDAEDGLTVTKPTCTTAGLSVSTCQNDGCGVTRMHTTPATGHKYTASQIAPTCTEQGYKLYTCENCDDQYIDKDSYVPATNHTWNDWTVSKAAKCEVEGEKTRTCKSCDAVETETIEALAHDYDAVIIAPTCLDAGYTKHTCANCGDVYQDETTTALGHDIVIDSAVAPSCTADGLTEGSHCGRCGVVLTPQVVIKVEGHKYEGVVTQPTCTEDGYTTLTCSACGDTYKDFVSEAPGHKYKETVVPPTCTAAGYTEVVCAVCDDRYTKDEVSASGHDYQQIVTAPTCTEDGYTAHTCKNCDDSYVTDRKNATGHSWGQWTVITEATCLNAGFQTHTCETCEISATEVIPANGHDYKATVIPATCTEDGYTVFQCSSCIDSYRDNIVTAPGHDLFHHSAKAPTCTKNGWMEYDTCAECDYTTFVEVEALGHDYASVVTEPTCTEAGYTTYTCQACGDSYITDETEATGHDFAQWKTETEAKCGVEGLETRGCKNCDAEESQIIPALEHVVIVDEAVEATCTEAGLTEGSHCDICGTTLIPREPVQKLPHQYESAVTEATCTEDGFTTHTCKVCGESYTDTPVEAAGHDYGDWQMTLRPTCMEEGAQRRDCTVCHHFETESLDPLDHLLQHVDGVESTCTEKGYKDYDTCARCNYTTYEELPLKTHDLGDVVTVVAPTCLEKGWGQQLCEDCDYGTLVEIDALDHDIISHDGKAADCTETGFASYETCSRCDYSTYAPLAALGHEEIIDEAVPPTCTETGLTEGSHCDRCGETFVEQEVVPAAGHDYQSVETKPTCTEDGYVTYTCSVCQDTYQTDGGKAIGHNYHGQVTKTATTERNGETTYTCENCQDTYIRLIPATVYGWMEDAETDSVTVQWKHIAAAEDYIVTYEIWTADAGTEEYQMLETVDGDVNQFTLTGLKPAEVKMIKLRAVMEFDGETIYGEYSQPITGMTALGVTDEVNAASTSASTVELTWSPVEHAEGYEIYMNKDGGEFEIKGSVAASDQPKTVLKGLESASTYGFILRAYVTVNGEKLYGDYCSPAYAATTLGVVTDVNVTSTSTSSAELSWSAVIDAEGYEVYYTVEDGVYEKYADTEATSLILENLKPGVKYLWKVRAYNHYETETAYGRFSEAVSCSTGIAGVTGLIVGKITTTTASVKWDAVTGADGYDLYLNAKGGKAELVEKIAGETETVLKDLNPATSYELEVRPYAVIGQQTVYGDAAAAAWTTTAETVTNLQIETVTETTISMTWDQMNQADGYEVYMSEDNGESFSRKALISDGETTSYDAEYLMEGSKYIFKVRGFSHVDNTTIYGDYSETAFGFTNLKRAGGLYIGYPTKDSLKASWSVLKNADGYEVYLSKAENSGYSLAKTISGADNNELLLENLDSLTTYYIKVRGYKKIDGQLTYGAYSNVESKSTTMDAVEMLTVETVTSSGVSLNWQDVENASGYEVYLGEGTNGLNTVCAATVTEPQAVLDGLKPASVYQIYIKAYADVNGTKVYSEKSSPVLCTTTLNQTTGVKIMEADSTSLQVAWNETAGAQGYQIYLKKAGDSDYSLVTTVKSGRNLTTMLDSLHPVTEYQIYVRAYAEINGETVYGEKSAVASGMTGLSQAAGLKVTGSTTDSLQIAWKEVTGAHGYQIYVKKAGDSDYILATTVKSGKEVTATLQTLDSAQEYQIYVRAYAEINGETVYGEKSAVASGMTGLSQAAGLKITGSTTDSLQIAWKEVTGAQGYQIYLKKAGDSDYSLVNTVKSGKEVAAILNTLNPAQGYHVCVRPYAEVSGKTIYGKESAAVMGVTTLGQTAGLKITGSTTDSLQIAWNETAGAQGYQIYLKKAGDSDYSLVNTVKSGKEVTATLNALNPAQGYHACVRPYAEVSGKTIYGKESAAVMGVTTLGQAAGLKITGSTTDSLQIAWDETAGAQGYQIYLKKAGDSDYSLVNTVKSGKEVTATLNALNPAQSYYVCVRSYAEISGKTIYGKESAAVIGMTALDKVEGAKVAVSTSDSLKLVWNEVAGAQGYQIYMKKAGESEFNLAATVNTGQELTTTLANLESAKGHYIYVRAYAENSGKTVYSEESTLMLGRTKPETIVKIAEKTSARAANSLTITWNQVKDADGYKVYRATKANGTYKLVKTIKSDKTTSAKFTKLKSATTYYYKVRAYSEIEKVTVQGSLSKAYAFTTKPLAKTVKLKAKSKAITVKWSKAPRAKGYQVYRATKKNGKYKLVKTVKGNKTFTFTNKNLKKGKTYYYKVRAYVTDSKNKRVYGNFSKVKGAKVK